MRPTLLHMAGKPWPTLPATALALLLPPGLALAATGHGGDLTHHWVGHAAVALFVGAYLLVMGEEFTHLRKSKPVLLAAGIIWGLIALSQVHHPPALALVSAAFRHNVQEFTELFLFLLVAMTYINAMDDRQVFEALRAWLTRAGFSYRQLFWLTGLLAFCISPVADNLTTALLMCAVVLAVGREHGGFVSLSCINIVVAANAGGAFSPFGDITTLMVWQKGTVPFANFFHLFLPALVNWLFPAAVMHFSLPAGKPRARDERVIMKRGARWIIALFLLTVATAVAFHNWLHLPPVLGMTTGLGYLMAFTHYLKITYYRDLEDWLGDAVPLNVYGKIARAEWDTLMFFYGVILCVGGLGFIGYLGSLSLLMYGTWGATYANVAVGVLSAVVDNIPIMFAVLTMHPEMSQGQWLLVTLTAGVGGSLLSVGSAAGVALMGQARGMYTFFGHLRWTPVIAMGYAAAILTHFWINSALF